MDWRIINSYVHIFIKHSVTQYQYYKFLPAITESHSIHFEKFFEQLKQVNLELAKEECMKLEQHYPSIVYYNLGVINYIEKNFELTEKYLKMGSELNCPESMFVLAFYHKTVTRNYELFEKYCLMGANLNHSDCMVRMGFYYKNINSNYKLMKKYYLMAINLNNSKAMNNLAEYYINKRNSELGVKYYKMAVKFGNIFGLINYGAHLFENNNNKRKGLKYLIRAKEMQHNSILQNYKIPFVNDFTNVCDWSKKFCELLTN